jgi:hypothetical protein
VESEEAAEIAKEAAQNAFGAVLCHPATRHEHAAAAAAQAALLREIIGNPRRRVHADEAWLRWDGGTVPKLARLAYEERSLPGGALAPARLAVLADALEEAGCAEEALLSHCRQPGPHVRGCWAVDLLLGQDSAVTEASGWRDAGRRAGSTPAGHPARAPTS